MAAQDRGNIKKAIALYESSIKSDPTWSVPWYNLGLIAKYERDWPASFRYNQEAVRRDTFNMPAWWNLGIAATALADWPEARRAWIAFGIEVPEGSGEIDADFGYTPIRINPHDDGEVIWTHRIDPARAVVNSVPLPESNHRFGDVLLHDGAPNGHRLLRGSEVPVFDELQILKSSRLGTFEATVSVASVEDLVALERIFRTAGAAAEDWSSIRYICRQCSEGRPHDAHDRGAAHSAGERRIGIAAESEKVAADLLQQWKSETNSRRASTLTTLLPPADAG